MLIELLSTSNYVSYNVKVAEVLGLHAAIYISELMSINDKAIRKNKTDNSAFKLDRKYMTYRTTLTEEEQIDTEKNLIKIGLLEKNKDDNDSIILNISVLTTLLMSSDEELIDNVKTLTKIKTGSQPKATKAEKIRDQLKSYIETSNEELKEAYEDWIDAVYAKQGWMSKKSVVAGQKVVDEFSQRNLDVALKVIEIASINGYRDIEWAVNTYKKEHNVSYRVSTSYATVPTKQVPLKTAAVSSEVF